MMEKEEGKFVLKNKCCQIIFYCVFIICLGSIFMLQKNNDIISHIVILLLLLLICSFFMIVFINTSINEKIGKRMPISFATNLLFSISSTMFIYNTKYLDIIFYPLISALFLFFILVIMSIFFLRCKYLKIEKGNDLSCLKITNYYMVPVYMVIAYLLEIHINKETASYFSNYYLLPLLAIQGLYELLDKESKKQHNSPDRTRTVERSAATL